MTISITVGAGQSVAASPGHIYEWGKPVAPGGPGDVPYADQTLNDVQIDAGNMADVAVLTNGTIAAWGGKPLANSSMTAEILPNVSNVVERPVDGNGSFDFLEQPGKDSACPNSTTVVIWPLGKNYAEPQVLSALNCLNVVQLAAGADHTFALTASGQVYVWGDDGSVLGLGPNVKREKSPTLNPSLTRLTNGTSQGIEITAGSRTGGMLVNGQAYCWGADSEDQCGTGSRAAYIYRPTAVDQGSLTFTFIDQGGNYYYNGHTLAMASNGSVWAWGDNAEGQLGNGTTINQNVPVPVSGLPGNIVDVRAGGIHSMALDAKGNVWTWGSNDNGQIGDGTNTNQLVPIEVLSGVSMISAGSLHSLAQ